MNGERAPLPEILRAPAAGPVLLFAPHADDEVLGAGGTLALHAEQGDPVSVVVAFDGRAGLPANGDPAVRRAESRAALAHLGVDDVRFLDHPEGHAPTRSEFDAAVDEVMRIVCALEPASVYAPWTGEQHLDHHVLARVVRAALAELSFGGLAFGYEVWTPLVPTHVVDVEPVIDVKRRALGEYRSQLATTDLVHAGLGLCAQRSLYVPGSRWAEAFRPLGLAG